MLKLTRFTVENLTAGCVTDTKQPSFSFALGSDQKGKRGQTVTVRHAEILNPDGTPYILFALTDNGHADVAYKMLLNTKYP